MKGKNTLKIAGVLMIIGGVIGFILALLALLGAIAMGHVLENTVPLGLIYLTGILTMICAVVEFIAGIVGVKNCARPENARTCIVWGGIVLALSLVSIVVSMIVNAKVDLISIVLSLVVPLLYFYGAIQNQNGMA